MECFIFKWLLVFYGGIVVIFGDMESGEMLDFVGFARSWYRSGCLGELVVKYFGNVDFARSLWSEQMRLVLQSNACSKM